MSQPLVFPFLPLFFKSELGLTENEAIVWVGTMNAIALTVMMVSFFVWGTISDRFGFKPTLMRSLMTTTITFVLMSISAAPWQIFGLRVLQGVAGGSGGAISAMAAASLPLSKLSMGMGILQTVQFLGSAIGPLIGALGATAFGYRGTFLMAGGMMAFIAAMAFIFIKEPPPRRAKGTKPLSILQTLGLVRRSPALIGAMLAVFTFQTAWSTSWQLLPLHIHSMAGSEADGNTAIGIVLTSTALGIALGGLLLGWLSPRVGSSQVVLVGILLTGLLAFPQFWITDTVQLAAIRFLMGVVSGGVVPALRSVLGEEADRDQQTAENMGSIYGLHQSASTGGFAAGSVCAAVIGGSIGLPATEIATGVMMSATAAWWFATSGSRPASPRRQKAAA